MVIPVSAGAADAWLTGMMGDLDLVNAWPLQPEAVLGANLADLSCDRELIGLIAWWRSRGAQRLLLRTKNPVVHQHYLRIGAQITYRELLQAEIYHRYIVPPEAFHRYFSRFRASAPVRP